MEEGLALFFPYLLYVAIRTIMANRNQDCPQVQESGSILPTHRVRHSSVCAFRIPNKLAPDYLSTNFTRLTGFWRTKKKATDNISVTPLLRILSYLKYMQYNKHYSFKRTRLLNFKASFTYTFKKNLPLGYLLKSYVIFASLVSL